MVKMRARGDLLEMSKKGEVGEWAVVMKSEEGGQDLKIEDKETNRTGCWIRRMGKNKISKMTPGFLTWVIGQIWAFHQEREQRQSCRFVRKITRSGSDMLGLRYFRDTR